MAGSEGLTDPYVATPRVRPLERVRLLFSSGRTASLDGSGGDDGGGGFLDEPNMAVFSLLERDVEEYGFFSISLNYS